MDLHALLTETLNNYAIDTTLSSSTLTSATPFAQTTTTSLAPTTTTSICNCTNQWSWMEAAVTITTNLLTLAGTIIAVAAHFYRKIKQLQTANNYHI